MVLAGMIDYSIGVSTNDVKTEIVYEYDYISITGFNHLGEPGHPALPAQFLSFVIPPDAKFERLEVISEKGKYLSGIFNIFPTQKPVPTSAIQEAEFTPPNEAVYSLNELYPSTIVKCVHEGNLFGYRIVSVLVTPLRYHPSLNKLHLSNHITFRIHYRSGVIMVKTITEVQKRLAQERVRALVVNDHQIEIYSPPLRGEQERGQSEYIIITGPAFVDAFEPLRQWKTKKGVRADIVTTSWIYSNYSDGDNPTKIRNFIKEAVDSGAVYFLLAGQCDWERGEEFVPRRDVYCLHTGYTFWDDIDTIPCDMYYSDLDGTWDGNNNGTYGEIDDGVDMYSNAYVGRAPVKDLIQIENFVTKVITYETSPSFAFIEKVLLPAGNINPYYPGGGINDTIATTIPDDWQKAKLYEEYGLLSRYAVRDSIDQGFHLSHMVGHGSVTRITYTGGTYYWHSDPGTQTNDSSNAIIVLSDACLTGAMDHTAESMNYDVLAERMVNTNKRCASATIMNSRFGWSSPVADFIGYTDEIAYWFFKTLFITDAFHLGEVLAATKDHLVPKAENDYWRYCLYEYTLFGDPEMPLWTDLPDTIIVTHAPIVFTGPGTFDVTVYDGQGMPLPGALVCCWIPTQDPVMHSTAYTDASGVAVVDVSPETPRDNMYVTVTKHNYIPYQGDAFVHEGGPFIAMSSMIMNDADENGQANLGEVIDLGVWARNWGNKPAVNVYGYLSESDPYASVSIPASKYGRIPVGDSSLSKPYHRFIVANNCPNKHVIEFDLEFTDKNDSCWISHLKVKVYAPILRYQDVSVVNDGNGDGLLVPGETADLVVTLKNDGDATAHSVLSLLTTSSDYIMVNDAFSTFGNIDPGATADNAADPFTITADSTAPYLEEIDFSVIVQAGVYTDTLDFTLMLYPPILTLQEVRVVGDDDEDGELEPGETGSLIVTMANEGDATADNVTSVLRTSSSYITIHDSTGTFGSIVSGNSSDNEADAYTVTADMATPYFSCVDFAVVVEAGAYDDTFDFTLNVGEYPPSDTGYYYAYYSSGPHIQSPVFEWFPIDTTQTEHPGVSLDPGWRTAYTVSLPFTFTYYGKQYDSLKISSDCVIAFDRSAVCWNMYNTPIPYEDGTKTLVAGVWDFYWPQDIGQNWPPEPDDIYYYYDESNHRFIIEFFRMKHWQTWHDRENFEIMLYDPAYYPTPTGDGEIVVQYLTAMCQENIWSSDNTVGIENETETIGIQYFCDTSYDYIDGVYHERAGEITDSFAIKYTTYPKGTYPRYQTVEGSEKGGCQSDDTPLSAFPRQTLMHAPYPNPFKRMTVIRYQIAEGVDSRQKSEVSLKIYDIVGRLIKSFDKLPIQPFNQVIWHGYDDVGRRVPAGVYFLRFETNDYEKIEKAILLR